MKRSRSPARSSAPAPTPRVRGWTVADEHVFSDDGISGGEFVKRPGPVRLISRLTPRAPFGVLITAEESRLGREVIQTGWVLTQIIVAGVRVFLYLEDRERMLANAMDKVMLSLANFASEMEREKAKQRTYDAMRRKAEHGYAAMGKTYGYDHLAVTSLGPHGRPPRDHVVQRIEAAVVRRIFALAAEGHGLVRIAKTPIADGVPPPRADGRTGWASTLGFARCCGGRPLSRKRSEVPGARVGYPREADRGHGSLRSRSTHHTPGSKTDGTPPHRR
jgi:DNA invertase Pin-like site-specific DNA recombinase